MNYKYNNVRKPQMWKAKDIQEGLIEGLVSNADLDFEGEVQYKLQHGYGDYSFVLNDRIETTVAVSNGVTLLDIEERLRDAARGESILSSENKCLKHKYLSDAGIQSVSFYLASEHLSASSMYKLLEDEYKNFDQDILQDWLRKKDIEYAALYEGGSDWCNISSNYSYDCNWSVVFSSEQALAKVRVQNLDNDLLALHSDRFEWPEVFEAFIDELEKYVSIC